MGKYEMKCVNTKFINNATKKLTLAIKWSPQHAEVNRKVQRVCQVITEKNKYFL